MRGPVSPEEVGVQRSDTNHVDVGENVYVTTFGVAMAPALSVTAAPLLTNASVL